MTDETTRAEQITLPGFEGQEPQQEENQTTAATLLQRVAKISFQMDYLKSPEDALIAWEVPGDNLVDFLRARNTRIAKKVAEETGADPEQILDKERRTPEQQQLLLKASAEDAVNRFNAFFASLYYNALESLDPEESLFEKQHNRSVEAYEIAEEAGAQILQGLATHATSRRNQKPGKEPLDTGFFTIKAQAALYFFALHEEMTPTRKGKLTEEQRDELKKIFKRLDTFYCKYEQEEGRALSADEEAKILNLFIRKEHPEKSKRTKAEESGAITSIGDRIILLTEPELQHTFTTSIKSMAGFFRKDPQTGKHTLVTDMNPALFSALAKATLNAREAGNYGEISVYLPSFLEECKISLNRYAEESAQGEDGGGTAIISRADSREILVNKFLSESDNFWGVFPGDRTEYRLMASHTYNPETEILTFDPPYFDRAFSIAREKEQQAAMDSKGAHKHYKWKSDLVHAAVVNERIPAAVEMACRIVVGVEQRGTKPDAKLHPTTEYWDEKECTWSITCKGLIEECPLIREKLKALPDATQRTKYLKRAFSAMYKVLRKKTDLAAYYQDLSITEVIPTYKNLGQWITVSHYGLNPTYKRPFVQYQEPQAEEPGE